MRIAARHNFWSAVRLMGGLTILMAAANTAKAQEGSEIPEAESAAGFAAGDQEPGGFLDAGRAEIAKGVYIERPIGRILSVRDGALEGNVRYGARTAHGSASVVTFTTFRPSGSAAVGAAMPSGLPLDGARLTGTFGPRVHPVLGGVRRHNGIDLAAAHGTPVWATADGVVSMASWTGGYGLLVALEHDGDVATRYGHLSRTTVRPGQAVRKGDVIGFVGSTGRSTGPHLHYEIRHLSLPIDPLG